MHIRRIVLAPVVAASLALTGIAVVNTDFSPTAVAQEASDGDFFTRTYDDGAVVKVPKEWKKGEPLVITGTGWLTIDKKSGSVAGLKLDMPNVSRTDNKYDNPTVWGVVEADDKGNFEYSIEWPVGNNSDAEAADWEVGTEHQIFLLTSSLKEGDTRRGYAAAKGIKIVDPAAAPTTSSAAPTTSSAAPTNNKKPGTSSQDSSNPSNSSKGSSTGGVVLGALAGVLGVIAVALGHALRTGVLPVALLPKELRQLLGL